jgi:hypothetical protein
MTAFVPNEGIPAPGILTNPPATQSSLEHRDDSPGSGAGIQPDITSRRDEFSYRVPRVTSYRGSGLYWWQNSGITAQVQQASAVSAGSMRLVIRDANGAEVFSRSLAEGGSFLTQNGVSGRWTIQVIYDDASGTVSFRVRRKA